MRGIVQNIIKTYFSKNKKYANLELIFFLYKKKRIPILKEVENT